MQKVLIISYFFPPCNLTASQRAYNWAKYLHEFGYEPIVITRKWDTPIQVPADMGVPSENQEIVTVDNHDYKVVYLPFKGSLRDRLYINRPNWNMIRKGLTLKELYRQNFSLKALPHANFFDEALRIIRKEGVRKLIVTANPFNCFHFGYQLKQEVPDLKWIADYRDDWTTTELSIPKGRIAKKIFNLEQKSERKWVGTAEYITSVSPCYTQKISEFTHVKGYTLLNGYDEKIEEKVLAEPPSDRFVITYNGSLYASQPIEPFLRAMTTVFSAFETKVKIELHFPGLAFDPEQEKRVREVLGKWQENIIITNRIPREDVLNIQRKSHLLLMISHEKIKGIPSSKLYEYIGLNKPVLLYPNDKDIIEETLTDTGLGIICENEEEIVTHLTELINEFIQSGKLSIKGIEDKIKLYSRRIQTKKLAELLDKL